MKRVLIIEDDSDINDLIALHLKDINLEVQQETSGTSGFELASKQNFDLIILDLMLPGMDGVSICQNLRAKQIFTPIFMLTAKAEELDKVLGLESGADDYMTKPFSVREFIARVKAILRREEIKASKQISAEAPSEIKAGDLHLNMLKRSVNKKEEAIKLTPKEFDLLCHLMQNPGKSFSREQLLSAVWGYEFNGYEHTVNSHINRLRTKIEPDLTSPQFILTSWGLGYRFNDDL